MVGIDAAVPWTSPLEMRLGSGPFAPRVQVGLAADGTGTFLMPEEVDATGPDRLHLRANDPNYRLGDKEPDPRPLQAHGVLEVPVRAIARLCGRVVAEGAPSTNARVQAFRWSAEGPQGPLLGRAETNPDGRFEIRVPPGVPVLLIAESVIQPTSVWPDKFAPLEWSLEDSTEFEDDLQRVDSRGVATEWLPAAVRSEGLHGTLRDVGELVIRKASTLTGTVRSNDGRALPGFMVVAQPTDGGWSRWREGMSWHASHGVVAVRQATSDAAGAFTLLLAPGVPFAVTGSATDPLTLAGEPQVVAMAPSHVDLVVPGELVTFVVTAAGKPVPRARIAIDGMPWHADDHGCARVLLGPEPVRVQAAADRLGNAVVDLPASPRPATVFLALEASGLVPVRIQLRSERALLQATLQWRPRNGEAIVMRCTRERIDQPFVAQVPPGAYELTLREWTPSPSASLPTVAPYLLPERRDVEVPAGGTELAIEGRDGGGIAIDVLAADGTRPEGSFRLLDAAGSKVSVMAVALVDGDLRVAMPGELQPDGVNRLAAVLPAGDYVLELDAGEYRSVRQQVVVTAGVTTTVRLRPR